MKPMMDEMHEPWMARCMADPDMMSDHPDKPGRMAACEIMWDKRPKSATVPAQLKHVGCGFEVKEITEQGTFEGLASVYANTDLGGDVVEPGAFKEFALTRDGMIRILDGHNTRAAIGKGKLTDTHLGLAIKGQFEMAVARAREVHALMKAHIIDGLSIGYDVLQGGAEIGQDGVRRLKALKLWEVSTTPFPMNQAALVSSVKGVERVTDIRELEELLRDAAGLSRKQATLHASAIWKTKSGQRDAGEDAGAMTQRLTEFFKEAAVAAG